MLTTPITIEVDAVAAAAYAAATPEEQRKIQAMLSLRLQDLTGSPVKSLRKVIDTMSREAQESGLTPEILGSILRDEKEE